MSNLLSDYDYDLPSELIAQRPIAGRDGSRLLMLDRVSGALGDRRFDELPTLLGAGDLLILNDTKVEPVRFLGKKEGRDALAEVLLHGPEIDGRRRALVRPSKRFKPGDRFIGTGNLRFIINEPDGAGNRWVSCESPATWAEAMATEGRMPLPPYIDRPADDDDLEEYQTLFAREPGAAAAPTAGLHFSTSVFERLAQAGIAHSQLTLHVGIGTFQPVRVEDLSEHEMHAERFCLSSETRRAIDECKAAGGRVIAVGTTSLRALETPSDSEWSSQGEIATETRLFVRPPHEFKRVDALLTNFHLPRSTLLMLISAFAGREHVLAAYGHAVRSEYRFFSYGDAMLIHPGVI